MQSTKSLFVLIPTIVLSLASCRTPQQTAVAQQQSLRANVERQEQMLRSLQTQMQQLQSLQLRQQMQTNRRTQTRDDDLSEIITEDFDTTQPVDTATGTPPLKSRRTEKRNRHAQTQTADAQEVQTEQNATRQTDLQHTGQHTATATQTARCHDETQTDTRQHTGLTWWQTTLCTLGATALLILLVWIALKILKRYFKPF